MEKLDEFSVRVDSALNIVNNPFKMLVYWVLTPDDPITPKEMRKRVRALAENSFILPGKGGFSLNGYLSTLEASTPWVYSRGEGDSRVWAKNKEGQFLVDPVVAYSLRFEDKNNFPLQNILGFSGPVKHNGIGGSLNKVKILELIARGETSVREIARSADMDNRRALDHINQLRKTGAIVSPQRYALEISPFVRANFLGRYMVHLREMLLGDNSLEERAYADSLKRDRPEFTRLISQSIRSYMAVSPTYTHERIEANYKKITSFVGERPGAGHEVIAKQFGVVNIRPVLKRMAVLGLLDEQRQGRRVLYFPVKSECTGIQLQGA